MYASMEQLSALPNALRAFMASQLSLVYGRVPPAAPLWRWLKSEATEGEAQNLAPRPVRLICLYVCTIKIIGRQAIARAGNIEKWRGLQQHTHTVRRIISISVHVVGAFSGFPV